MHSISTPSQAITVLAEIRSSIANSTSIHQVRNFRDQAEAIRHYMKSAAMSLSMQNQASELKLVSERRIGQLLSEVCLRGGDRRSAGRKSESELEKLGLNRNQSARYQLEASIDEADFRRFVERANAEGRELTSQALIKLAKSHAPLANRSADAKSPFIPLITGLNCLARQGKQFSCVYAEPPWFHGNSKAEIARLPKRLCGLPVKPVAAKNAHLHLWVPPERLETGLTILRAWGFRYKGMLVREKLAGDYGPYWRPTHEVLLLGVRGKLEFRDSNLPSMLSAHSALGRPGIADIRSLVSRASSPPFLDLFGLTAVRDWIIPCP